MLNAAAATTRLARGFRETAFAYLRLTKPRIVGLLVVTTIPAMILADGGMPSGWLILATVTGGSIVAGGANATPLPLPTSSTIRSGSMRAVS